MKLKDFVNIIVFSIIGFVLMLIGGYAVMVFGPYMFYAGSSIASLIAAPLFITMSRKIPKRGLSISFYFINGLIYAVMGMWPMLVVAFISGIIGEVIIGKEENYLGETRLCISYVIAQLVYALHGYYFILYFGIEGIIKQFGSTFDTESANQVRIFYSSTSNLIIVIAIQIILSVIGFKIGIKIYNKYFSKSKKKSKLG